MRHCLVLILLLAVAIPAFAAQPAGVSYYECLRCTAPPTLDGKLDDPAWQSLPLMDQFFKYWALTPAPPPLKTVARLCYDDRGLYLGIQMYEDRMDQVRATVDSRDNPLTWMDDCVEVMIDPTNGGTGYYKFCTNLNAARYDEKATNMVLDSGWNVEGWQAKTGRFAEGWTIELSFPWTDLQHTPRAGDIWSFALVRYGYSSGGFKGTSWSLGGAGAHPAHFGYLSFGPFAETTLPRLAQAAAPTKGRQFQLLRGQEVLTYDRGRWERAPLRRWLRTTLRQVEGELDAAEACLGKLPAGADRTRLEESRQKLLSDLNELRDLARSEPVPSATAALVDHEARLLLQQVTDLRYEALLLGLVAES